MSNFFTYIFRYNWVQFTPCADNFSTEILKKAEASDLINLPSRFMQLVLCGKRQFKLLGAVITMLSISTISICCALFEDYIQFRCDARLLAFVGRILCCIVFLFQFDLQVRVGKRKSLMLLYLVFALFYENSFLMHLGFLILFNCMFFLKDSSGRDLL